MATYDACDIAAYIITHEHKSGREISNLRLQKLLYFVQAYIVRTTGAFCFDEDMEAWTYGPVVPSVYYKYDIFAGLDIIEDKTARAPYIDKKTKQGIDKILDYLSHYRVSQLVNITHDQNPWQFAYSNGLKSVITKDSMREYFKRSSKDERH